MPKILFRISIPIILAGIFIITVFLTIDYNKLNVTSYILLGLMVAYVFFFGFSVGQNFAQPVKKLLDQATDLSEGNLSSRVYIESKDEFAQLANVFNKIADELQASHVNQEKAEQSLDMKVRAKTQELNEVVSALEQKVRNRTAELDKLMKESDQLRLSIKAKEDELTTLRQKGKGGIKDNKM